MSPTIDVLFFSRGRGYGHAIPDIAIAEELHRLAPAINLRFVSYGTGAGVFRRAGVDVIDLAQPERNLFTPTLIACHRLITRERPAVVLAHEEFAALTAAKLADVPSVFMSAWLPESGTLLAEALGCAASIVVIEEPGLFSIPQGVQSQPYYAGRILRKLQFTRLDRDILRGDLGLERDTYCLVVVPGGSYSEAQFPIADIVVSAFLRISEAKKRLIWISAKDSEPLKKQLSGLQDVVIVEYSEPIERHLAVADVVITKGTRGITLDAAAVGVPSISLSPAQNPIDDILVPRIRSNIALVAKAVTGEILLRYLNELRVRPPTPSLVDSNGLALTAQWLAREITRRAIESVPPAIPPD